MTLSEFDTKLQQKFDSKGLEVPLALFNRNPSRQEIIDSYKEKELTSIQKEGYPESGSWDVVNSKNNRRKTNPSLSKKVEEIKPQEGKIEMDRIKTIFMNFQPISQEAIPVLRREGSNSVRISSNGQLSFSTKATEHVKDAFQVVVLVDNEAKGGRMVALVPCGPDVPKTFKGQATLKLGKGKKTGNVFTTASGILQYLKYDYRTNGTQVFSATWDEKNKMLIFPLPTEQLVPKVIKPRVKKEHVNGVASGASPVVEVTEAEVIVAN